MNGKIGKGLHSVGTLTTSVVVPSLDGNHRGSNDHGSVVTGIFDDPDGLSGNYFGDAIEIAQDAKGGNDHMIGTNDPETIYGDAWLLGDNGRGGNDIIVGLKGDDELFGDANIMEGESVGGNDRIIGGDGDNMIFGDAFFAASANVHGGNDRIIDGDGNSAIHGDFFAGGEGGDDVIHAGGGNDNVFGGGGDDFADGGSGIDTVSGEDGDDILNGGADPDFLMGGSGSDKFVIEPGTALDWIGDFNSGEDVIDLRGFDLTFGDLDTDGSGEVDAEDSFVDPGVESIFIDLGAAAGGAAISGWHCRPRR